MNYSSPKFHFCVQTLPDSLPSAVGMRKILFYYHVLSNLLEFYREERDLQNLEIFLGYTTSSTKQLIPLTWILLLYLSDESIKVKTNNGFVQSHSSATFQRLDLHASQFDYMSMFLSF